MWGRGELGGGRRRRRGRQRRDSEKRRTETEGVSQGVMLLMLHTLMKRHTVLVPHLLCWGRLSLRPGLRPRGLGFGFGGVGHCCCSVSDIAGLEGGATHDGGGHARGHGGRDFAGGDGGATSGLLRAGHLSVWWRALVEKDVVVLGLAGGYAFIDSSLLLSIVLG